MAASCETAFARMSLDQSAAAAAAAAAAGEEFAAAFAVAAAQAVSQAPPEQERAIVARAFATIAAAAPEGSPLALAAAAAAAAGATQKAATNASDFEVRVEARRFEKNPATGDKIPGSETPWELCQGPQMGNNSFPSTPEAQIRRGDVYDHIGLKFPPVLRRCRRQRHRRGS